MVADGVCFSLEELLGVTECGRTGLLAEDSYDRMLVELLRAKALRSFVKCIRKRVFVDGSHVCDRSVWVMFVKPGFMQEDPCPTLKDYDRAADRMRTSRTED